MSPTEGVERNEDDEYVEITQDDFERILSEHERSRSQDGKVLPVIEIKMRDGKIMTTKDQIKFIEVGKNGPSQV